MLAPLILLRTLGLFFLCCVGMVACVLAAEQRQRRRG